MSHLIYGILRAREASRLDPTAGLEGSPVSVVTVQGISAVCATVSQCPPASDLSSILSYAQVVSLIHSKCTVLPARFGSCCASEATLKEMLERRAMSFLAALDAIEGCEEMGLRAVWGTLGINSERERGQIASGAAPEPLAASAPVPVPARSGKEYMALLRARHEEREVSGRSNARAVETFRDAFAGLFVRFQAEESRDPDHDPLSVHFLTPRQHRERFVHTFHGLRDQCQMHLLLTGPWPPYHFSAVLSAIDGPGAKN